MPWFVLNQTRNSVDKDGGMPASAGPQANKCTSAAALGVETKRIFIETSLAQIHPRLQSLTLLSSSSSSSCFLGVYKEREVPASTTSTRLIRGRLLDDLLMSTSTQDLDNIFHTFDMGSLRTHLPIKRKGLSKYFSGQSKSFKCLADAKCVEDLKKTDVPERKRRKYLDRRAAASNNALLFSCSS
nr:PREDICTED: uncharacterized protein LOC108953675 [Musa acuminata subsp. malaccensis]